MSTTTAQPVWGRWVAAGALLLLLLWLGSLPPPLFGLLTRLWQHLLAAAGLTGWLARLQSGTSAEVTTRSLPAMLSFTLLYLALCLLLLRVLLGRARQWWAALGFYAAAVALSVGLLLAGWLAGNAHLLYKGGRQLIDFLVSPLPILGLLTLFWPVVRRTMFR